MQGFTLKRFLLTLSVLLVLLAAGTAGWIAFGPVEERTRLLFHDPRGTATEGTVLGVRIGQPWVEADRILRDRFDLGKPFYSSESSGGHTPASSYTDQPILVGEAVAVYRDTGWQNGVIVLRLRDGIVMGVSWNYAGPLYVDF
tara:strand:- start:744 stop:1172 length:429 start_codon:yes stop_codon:yes gene_type:complete